jgi:menaquinone-dependent protoporphyrinogen oxidase
MTRILILYATSHGHTRTIAQVIADRLRSGDVRVTMADLQGGQPLPALSEYDAVVLGSRVHFDRHAPALRAYVAANRRALARLPCYLFSVSMAAAATPHTGDPHGYLARLSEELAWRPRLAVAFGGALPYRSYNPVMRWLMKQVSRRAGHPTDTTRDHVLTDWAAVRAFADEVVACTLTDRVRVRDIRRAHDVVN